MQITRPEKNITTLSRAIANQSVGKGGKIMPAMPVFQGKFVNTSAAPIQLLHKRWKPDTPATDKEHAGEIAAGKVSAAVDTAHTELNANNLADANEAYQALYLLRLREHGKGVKTMHPSTAAGYIIESKVNNRLAGEEGFKFQNSALLPGTRPDICVSLGDGHTALIDITAGNSLGHIFAKKSNWANHVKIPYVAEAWYPSINFDGKAATLSPDQIRAAEALAEDRRELAGLMQEEKTRQKTEMFNEGQLKIFNALINAPLEVFVYIRRNSRTLELFTKLGVDVTAEGPMLLSLQERNVRCELTPTEENPVPNYLQSYLINATIAITKAKNVAELLMGKRRKKQTPLNEQKKGKPKRIYKPAKTRKT